MLYGITQCYLPPDRGVNSVFTQTKQVLDLATQGSHASWKVVENPGFFG